MKRLTSLDISSLKGREWYHQRFDGCPMFIYFIAEPEVTREKRKPAGTEADERICFFGDGKADWYLDMKDVMRGASKIISLAKKDPVISIKLLKAWKKDEQAFENCWKEFSPTKLKNLSDETLISAWDHYLKLAFKRFTSSSIIDHFALGTDEQIGQMLRRELVRQGKIFEKESEFTNIFSIATAPVHLSFINQAEIDLLKIAAGESKLTIRDYQKKYFWTKNNYYLAKVLSAKHFENELRFWKKSGKGLNKEWRRIAETPHLNFRNKKELFQKHKFSQLLKTLLKISEDFTLWQDERKKATYLNIHMGNSFLKELSRRTGYDLDELKYAVPHEVRSILTLGRPKRKELKSRSKESVFIVRNTGYFITSGPLVQKIKRATLVITDLKNIRDFRGLSASMGRATGKVKVVRSATEVAKVKQGDILVAVMTRPDYIVAMKKAAAIVTNEGGITSHAAIVSRELGIPCIIATKIATEVLRDGDLIEVNANHGWVRKLN